MSLISMHIAVWELVQRPTRQLFPVRWGLRGDGVAWRWPLERRSLQLSPCIHMQERHQWVKGIHNCMSSWSGFFIWLIEMSIMSTIFISSNSLLWATTKSPKCLHIWKGSTEIRNKCSCSLSLFFGFPAETESSGQVSVRRRLGEAKDPLH